MDGTWRLFCAIMAPNLLNCPSGLTIWNPGKIECYLLDAMHDLQKTCEFFHGQPERSTPDSVVTQVAERLAEMRVQKI